VILEGDACLGRASISLRSGDPVQGLSEAYGRLFEAVTKVREQQSQQFAVLLNDWTASGSKGDQVISVEDILERIVTPWRPRPQCC